MREDAEMTLKKAFSTFVAFALFGLTAAVAAQSSRDSLIVSSSWLAAHLKDSNLVLLHLGDKTDYGTRHIAGARFVTLADVSMSGEEAGGLNLQMPPTPVLHDRLAAFGISDNSRIVVYYQTTQITSATRVMLTLDYAGFGDKSSLLDGGMGAWVKEGHELTAEVPVPKAGTLAPLKIKPLIVDAAFVKSNLAAPNTSVVDARLAPFYDGTQVGGSPQAPHKTGHIDGARNIPWSDLTTDQQSFKPTAELKARFEKAGVKPGDTVVGYCHIGQQATAMIFAARTLGFKVLLYDGSFEEWSKLPGAPVSTIKR
jgi:thiosulfate/3-mercaptopyruvate sulfurtransferase